MSNGHLASAIHLSGGYPRAVTSKLGTHHFATVIYILITVWNIMSITPTCISKFTNSSKSRPFSLQMIWHCRQIELDNNNSFNRRFPKQDHLLDNETYWSNDLCMLKNNILFSYYFTILLGFGSFGR